MWDDAVLTVDDGKEQRFSGEQLVWHLAQLCERCGTLLIPVSFSRGLVLVHDGADLVAALDGSYRPFVRGCSHCCGPQAPVPEYLAERDCESRYMRKKKVHNFTQGSPGPWNAGDIIWCLRCGKQAYSTAYLPCFLEGDAGMGMPGV
jgi:hypothetical protein